MAQRQADAGLTVTTSTTVAGSRARPHNTLFATLDIWDVTDRNQPTLVGHRVMNDNGASLSPPPPKRSWAPEGVAVAKSLMVMPLDITHEFDGVTSQNLDTFGVFSSLNLLGLGMVDLQRNVPPIFDFAERKGTIPTGTLIDTEATWDLPAYQASAR